MGNPVRSIAGGISAAIVLLGLVLAFAFGGFNLTIFFIALAIAALVGSFGSLNPNAVYGSLYGFSWLLMLALFFATGSWLWFLVGAAISILLSTLRRPILALLLGMGIFGVASIANRQQPQPYYQPSQSYQQGYQPPVETYQEGGQAYHVQQNQPQYEPLQVQNPEQMPPQ